MERGVGIVLLAGEALRIGGGGAGQLGDGVAVDPRDPAPGDPPAGVEHLLRLPELVVEIDLLPWLWATFGNLHKIKKYLNHYENLRSNLIVIFSKLFKIKIKFRVLKNA